MGITNNKSVNAWIEEMKNLTNPDSVVLIDGSEELNERLRAEALKSGELIQLNQDKLPGCYLHRTAVNDVARVEGRTFICTEKQEDAGSIKGFYRNRILRVFLVFFLSSVGSSIGTFVSGARFVSIFAKLFSIF